MPACLRMVLLSLGVDVPESDLRAGCDTTILGTEALKAVDAVRTLGFPASAKYTLKVDELRDALSEGEWPIVFVSLLCIDARDDIHALIVTGFAERDVFVLDPLVGERTIPLRVFAAAWSARHNLTILIRR